MTDERIPLNVPDIGDTGKIELVAWNIAEGADVEENQELCELVTDKAAFPLESPYSGTVLSIEKNAGETVKIGETLAFMKKN